MRLLLTGGASGLGKELALMLIQKNHEVIVIDKASSVSIDKDYFNKLFNYVQLDLSDNESVILFINNYLNERETEIDAVIINAFPRQFRNFISFEIKEMKEFVNSSFLNQILITHTILKKMFEKDFGRIIVISSKSGIQGYSTGSLYCSMKSAWITFHESLEKELKITNKNITITTICPGSFSDQQGNKYKQYENITGAVKKITLQAITHNSSGIFFPATFRTKLILSIQLLHKLLKLW